MIHSVLIQNGAAHQIWRDTPKSELEDRLHADLIAQIVEVTAEVDCGDVWDGKAFAPAPQPVETRPPIVAPTDKLVSFLRSNPDVLALIEGR